MRFFFRYYDAMNFPKEAAESVILLCLSKSDQIGNCWLVINHILTFFVVRTINIAPWLQRIDPQARSNMIKQYFSVQTT